MADEKGLKNTFNKTNLDLTNSLPLGGPINDQDSGFEHKYSPQNPYYTGNEGTLGETSFQNAQTQLGITGLDNTDESAGTPQGGTGGPNRVAPSIPTGEYKNVNLQSGDTISTVQVQRYTPENTYWNSIQGIQAETPPNPEPSPPSDDITGVVPGDIDKSKVNIP